MKASIDENGVMLVEPETPLETFAVREWCKSAFSTEGDGHWQSSKLIVATEMRGAPVTIRNTLTAADIAVFADENTPLSDHRP